MRVGFSVFLCTIFFLQFAQAQPRPTREFQITRITKNLISTAEYNYGGGGQYRTNPNDRWVEVETEFMAAPDWTDEITLKYYVLLNGRLLTGEVTHVNIVAGSNRSVMYVVPVALTRFAGNRPVVPTMIQNVAVQLLQGGAVKDELSLARTPGQWFAGLSPITGFILNKNETPFAPLYWDRYAQIKAGH